MRIGHLLTGIALLLLGAASGIGLFLSRDQGPPAVADGTTTGQGRQDRKGSSPRRERTVDTEPLLRARRLASLVVVPEEQEFARQAERLADHAVDLAFADAMRRAVEGVPDPSPELRALLEAKAKAQKALDADEALIGSLTAQIARADETERGPLAAQLEVVQAQRELTRGEFEAASDDVARAGGDPQARIRRLKSVYETAQKEARPTPAAEVDKATRPGTSLLARWRLWRWQKAKVADLALATRENQEKAQRIGARRETLAGRMRQEAEAREAAKRSAGEIATGASDGGKGAAVQATVTAIKGFSDGQRRLTDLGRRMRDHLDLAEVYAGWSALVEGHARAALHRLLRSVAWVLGIALLTFLATLLVERLFRARSDERQRGKTLQGVAVFAARLVGVLAIVFVVFGVPAETGTILGLAGAGLTVALKDFIVAFFGWFVLMGRDGIRVGDWVEIKGVGGEVVEIGLLHTVLLETGNWSDAGHPTGRRVSFVNSFAIEGHFFNFSSSGKWMWDDLKVLVPLGQDPYPIVDAVRRLVETATEENARLAEQEWKSGRYRVQTLSAKPGIGVAPTATGIEIRVRYITRVRDRHEARKRLYQEVVRLMHGKQDEPPAAT